MIKERAVRRKVRTGRVVSDKMMKTVVVAIESYKAHPVYKKRIRRTEKYHVHDEKNEAKMGDTVFIMETRPLSKKKRWRLVQIIGRGSLSEGAMGKPLR